MATKVTIENKPLSDYVEALESGEPFSFSRWGDGEWRAVFGMRGSNVDGHQYFPEMGKSLLQVLESKPQYRLGLQPLASRIFAKEIQWHVNKHKLPTEWENADVFHKALRINALDPLVAALKKKPIILLGPSHLSKLNLFKFKYISVPTNNCYQTMDSILQRTELALKKQPSGAVVSISASMPAEILLDRLYRSWGHKHYIIDFGSLWDPYVGVKSRAYHRKLKL